MCDMERKVAELESRIQFMESVLGYNKTEEKIEEEKALYRSHVNKTEAANMLGVTRATIYAMLADGRLKASMGGKAISLASIEAFIRSESQPGLARGRYCRRRAKE